MMSGKALDECEEIIKELEKSHLLAGTTKQKISCCKALLNVESNEDEVIYNLVETHSPGLRTIAVYNYEMIFAKEEVSDDKLNKLQLCKDSLNIKCSTYPMQKKIDEMLQQIAEMPKEWTIVQLTPAFNPLDIWNEDNDTYYTNSIFISVLSCAKNKPFFVKTGEPRDPVNGHIIELAKEMLSIIKDYKDHLSSTVGKTKFKNLAEKTQYKHKNNQIQERLMNLINDIQQLWLKEWRCLLTGKYSDEKLEEQISTQIKTFIQTQIPEIEFTYKIEFILSSLVKNYKQLNQTEIHKLVKYCFPKVDDKIIQSIEKMIKGINYKISYENAKIKRNPLILIIHDSLDCFPWELIDVLQNQPTSRIPSFHFLYCLFKEHEDNIIDGYKVVRNYENGKLVINPTLDLKTMENRMVAFHKYWTPKWTGTIGSKPSKDEFIEFLTESDIFSYNGHGSGTSYVSFMKLKKSHVKAVVLLFGCCSSKIARTDPQADMIGNYFLYLIARCPCLVGMLWEVPNISTDLLSTSFMSYWIPSKAVYHWKYVNKESWKGGVEKDVVIEGKTIRKTHEWEPDLLSALLNTKKESQDYLTKAACVARGIPVKILKA